MKKFMMSAALSFMVIGSVFANNDKPSNAGKDSGNLNKKYKEIIKTNATDELKQAYAEKAAAEKEFNLARIEIMKSDIGNSTVAEAYGKALNDMGSGKKDKAQYNAFKDAQREFDVAWKNNHKKYEQDQRLQAVMAKKDEARKAIESAEADIRKNNPEAEKLWNSSNDAKKLAKEEKIAKHNLKKAEKSPKAEKAKKIDKSKKVEKAKKTEKAKKVEKAEKPEKIEKSNKE